jgi:hypothetical protein
VIFSSTNYEKNERRLILNLSMEVVWPIKLISILVITSWKKELREGDSFIINTNIVADMLVIMIERAKLDDQIEAEFPHLVDGVLSIHICADDTIPLYES